MKDFFKRLFEWERWPYDIMYAPVSVAWLYYAIKARALWFFTPVNPSLQFAGFEGNSKKEMYQQLPKWCLPETLYIENTKSLDEIKSELKKIELSFPIIAKPDRGMQGVLFRVILRGRAGGLVPHPPAVPPTTHFEEHQTCPSLRPA